MLLVVTRMGCAAGDDAVAVAFEGDGVDDDTAGDDVVDDAEVDDDAFLRFFLPSPLPMYKQNSNDDSVVGIMNWSMRGGQ